MSWFVFVFGIIAVVSTTTFGYPSSATKASQETLSPSINTPTTPSKPSPPALDAPATTSSPAELLKSTTKASYAHSVSAVTSVHDATTRSAPITYAHPVKPHLHGAVDKRLDAATVRSTTSSAVSDASSTKSEYETSPTSFLEGLEAKAERAFSALKTAAVQLESDLAAAIVGSPKKTDDVTEGSGTRGY